MMPQVLKKTIPPVCSARLGPVIRANAVAEEVAAKKLFGAQALPALMPPQPAGFYSKGCLSAVSPFRWTARPGR